MFTLKLYKNGPLPGVGRTVVMEVAGIWVNHLDFGVKEIITFTKRVGTQDEDGGHTFYVGGDIEAHDRATAKRNAERHDSPRSDNIPDDIPISTFDTYFGWGVMENAQGKTTEMFR